MAAKPSIYERVLQQNAGRDPVRLGKKLQMIAGDPFAFFRGTNPLFYETLAMPAPLRKAPRVLCCGDLHLENFGSFRGANRLVYFDLNDFDEACVAPLSYEVLRFLASIFAGAESLGLSSKQAQRLCKDFLARYAATLAEGKPGWLERLTARGVVKQLLDGLRERHRNALLTERTHVKDGKRILRQDGKRILPVPAKEQKGVRECLKAYAKTRPDPGFYRVMDIGARVAGNGSLGLPRYIILVQGRGGPDGQFLLDLKAAQASAVVPYISCPQPGWKVEGARVVSLQKVVSAMAPDLLAPVSVQGRSFVLKELQPAADRLDLDATRGNPALLAEVIEDMARLTAWGQLRSCARFGAALPDELMRFGATDDWVKPLLHAAQEAAELNFAHWQAFRQEYMRRTEGEAAMGEEGPHAPADTPTDAPRRKKARSSEKNAHKKTSGKGMSKAKGKAAKGKAGRKAKAARR